MPTPMPTRGRPRQFDRDIALQRAMEVFWARGYEATQVSDLLAALAMNAPSFYATFHSKEAVYREAIDLYVSSVGGRGMKALQAIPDVRAALKAMLEAAIEVALASRSAGGCMVSLGLIHAQAQNAGLRDHLRDLRRTTSLMICDRLKRGVANGELPSGLDAEEMARFFATVLHGLSLQAQDGASAEELAAVATRALSVLPRSPDDVSSDRTGLSS